ncbi:hypothetical protein F1188_08705 [Roseospira marina]|uniref:Uncharacterized protein n=1 Tax=Roseospira marina TaxID=140057 RepID=A0A5M6IDN6_9PROT|nr:hypothetical protein [Roseospira marina]KAA5606077.1 hypothetical protein F1188_08705 [Roseospira marina]MBB4313057.1 ribosomal protein L9 [Roseospira marina]MBB5086202.1 ribosomal protein L9 [Roseospira marina]
MSAGTSQTGSSLSSDVPLGSTPASDGFARNFVTPSLNDLAKQAQAANLTTADFVDALVNAEAAFLASILGPKVTGDMLQALGAQISQTAAASAHGSEGS